MGSATSDFQSQPYVNNKNQITSPRTDWESQVHKLRRNQSSKILGEQNISEFPRFFENKDFYVNRCVDIGENMFRTSFDFGRLCPKPHYFDEDLMSEYVSVLAAIRTRGLEPMLTLYHWPTPLHLLKRDSNDNISAGAWEHSEVLTHFHFYIKNVLEHLSNKDFIRRSLEKAGYDKDKQDKMAEEGLVRYFISINEPISLLLPTYIAGVFPPFKKFRFDLLAKVTSKLVNAHDLTLNEIKNSRLPVKRGALKVGVAHNWTYFDGLFKGIAHHLVNSRLTHKFEMGKRETDFVGLHYYFRMKPSFSRHKKVYGDNPYFGDMHPLGIKKVLEEMHSEYPGKDIFITEFGFSDSSGLRRPFWILETVRHVIEALENGVPLKGMLLWTLVNNFEWNLGVNQKFGLFDEEDLNEPLIPSTGRAIKSWEAWSAAARAFIDPTPELLQNLQVAYERARTQFHEATEGKVK